MTDVVWTLDGEALEDATGNLTSSGLTGGSLQQTQLLLQEQYLVLRNVSAKYTGSYSCHVRNARGATVSNVLDLRVQCKSFQLGAAAYCYRLYKLKQGTISPIRFATLHSKK